PADVEIANAKRTEVTREVVTKLGISPKQIYDIAGRPAASRKPQTNRRATAYRVFADATVGDERSRAWALNNAAHIYLNKKDFVRAKSLGKRALDITNQKILHNAMNAKEIRDLKSKAALTVSVAAQQLGHKEDAVKFRQIAIQNGSEKAKR